MESEILNTEPVIINFSEMEKVIMKIEDDNVIFEIVALGKTSIPVDKFFDGVDELRKRINK